MKTKLSITMCVLTTMLLGQVSTPFNFGAPTDFVGWAAGNLFPLNIEHQGPFRIDFRTDNFERMRINHIANGAPLQNYLGCPANPLPGNSLTRVSISRDGNPINNPQSMLHIGSQPFPWANALGNRFWMDVGTMYVSESDNLYTGMREKSPLDPTGRTSTVIAVQGNSQDAVITWGENYANFPPGPDNNLCFIFHTELNPFNPDLAASDYGLEVMRMAPSGHVGIGPAFTDIAQPQNLLHINSHTTAPAYLQITSQNVTGQTIIDGFHLGVTNAGIAEVKQMENQNLNFLTNNAQRAVITNIGDIGFNTNTPGNKLEIASSAGNPYFGPGGSSGLRFRNLNSLSTPIAAGFNGVNPARVLSVDQFGDVVLTNATPALGNLCTGLQNPFTADYEFPLSNANIFFSGDANATNRVNIGLPCASPSQTGKLNVYTAFATNTVWPGSVSISAYNSAVGTNFNYGVFAVSQGTSLSNTGIGGFAIGPCNTAIGGRFYAQGGTSENIGVYGYAVPTIGSSPTIPSYATGVSIGVYGNSAQSSFTLDYAGFFDGPVWINSIVNGTGWASTSDQQFKTQIDTITNALNIIKQLKPKTFYFDSTNIYGFRFSKKRQYGLIAQQVQTVLPELVSNQIKPATRDSMGTIITPSVSYKTLNYDAFTAIIIRAIQQLSAQNHKQDSLITKLIDCCKKNGNNGNGNEGRPKSNGFNTDITQLQVDLSDKDFIVLDQNQPNPFAESCVINYNIPVEFKVAQIVFNATDGRIIKTVDIKEKGRGQLNVFANDLSNGIYSYYLMVDGKIIDTKKLVKQD